MSDVRWIKVGLSEALIRKVDAEAKRKGQNRSETLQQLAEIGLGLSIGHGRSSAQKRPEPPVRPHVSTSAEVKAGVKPILRPSERKRDAGRGA